MPPLVTTPDTRARVAACCSGAALLLLYGLTLQRHIPGGDAPELVTAALTGGVAHPPGYPLYSLLLRAVVLPSPAWAALCANGLSAVCASLTGACMAALVASASKSAWRGVSVALAYGVSQRVWTYATGAEVFALNQFLCVLTLWRAWHAFQSPSARNAALLGVTLGLALSNHHTALLAVGPAVLWSAFRGNALKVLLGALVGLTPYALLPLWSRNAATMTWGDTGTWAGWFTHLLRREYGTFQLMDSAGSVAPGSTLRFEVTDVWNQTLGVGAVLMAASLVWVLKGGRAFERAVAAGLLVHVVVFHALNNMPVDPPLLQGVLARFFLLPLMLGWLLVGVGGIPVPSGVMLLLAAVMAVRSLPPPDSGAVETYGHELLRVMPRDALVLTEGDLITGSMRFMQASKHERPDVLIVDQEELSRAWGVAVHQRALPAVVFPAPRFHPREANAFSLLQLVMANLPQRPVVMCGGWKPGDDSVEVLSSWPRGLCTQVFRPGTQPSLAAWLQESATWVPQDDRVMDGRWEEGSWDAVVQHDLLDVNPRRALHVMVSPDADGDTQARFSVAADLLQEHVKRHPNSPPHVFKNVGLACSRVGRTPCMVDAWRRYLRDGDPTDADRPALEEALRQAER